MVANSKGKLFPTQEIGSVTKPSWRIRGISGAPIGKKEIEEAKLWGERLAVPGYDELIKLLSKLERSGKSANEHEKEVIRDWAIRYVLALFGKVGLDRVYSGEQWRVEMYEHLVQNVPGFKLLGSVQSFDYKYYTKGAVVSPIGFKHSIYLDELKFVEGETKKDIKLPMTGPYTIVDWSFNEFYETRLRNKNKSKSDLRRIYFDARRDFILDLVRKVFRREIALLIKNGVRWIQIDEPAITTKPNAEEMELFVEAINESTRGFSNCKFSVHNCYSDYRLLAKYAPRLKDIKELALEFANRDSIDLGLGNKDRPGYTDLLFFEKEGYKGNFGLGVVHVHDYSGSQGSGGKVEGRDVIETPELVRDRILYASKILGGPARISANPDCGLRTRSWDVIYRKLSALSEGTKLARKQFE